MTKWKINTKTSITVDRGTVFLAVCHAMYPRDLSAPTSKNVLIKVFCFPAKDEASHFKSDPLPPKKMLAISVDIVDLVGGRASC
jgi:hypothetical protein